MCNNPKQVSGFTLLQLMAVIAIAGVLMVAAIPTFRDMIRRTRLTTYTNEFVTALNIARSEAVKRGQHVVVRKTGTNWENGWQVFVDVDRPTGVTTKENVFNDDGDSTLCEPTEDCLLRTYSGFPTPYTLRSGSYNYFARYQPDGSGNLTVGGSFILCSDATPAPYTFKLIIINGTGKIQMGRDLNNDGKPDNNDGTSITSCS